MGFHGDSDGRTIIVNARMFNRESVNLEVAEATRPYYRFQAFQRPPGPPDSRREELAPMTTGMKHLDEPCAGGGDGDSRKDHATAPLAEPGELGMEDLSRAGGTLSDAFRNDPLWNRVFEGLPDVERKRRAFFEIPVRYCLRYGTVRATPRREGIAAWVPGEVADMTFWRMLRSGALFSGVRIGATVMNRLKHSLGDLETHRRENMKGRPFLYLAVIGVDPRCQGQGLGGSLLRAFLRQCDQSSRLAYLETETEENVRMYERFGFRTVREVSLPGLGLPLWEMVRE
jgi:ribosomal protein S18 acetylase RimI-like enzyme